MINNIYKMELHKIKKSEDFLKFLKDKKITQKKLKEVVFGGTATQAIKIVRREGQKGMKSLIKMHQVWWQTKFAINECLKNA